MNNNFVYNKYIKILGSENTESPSSMIINDPSDISTEDGNQKTEVKNKNIPDVEENNNTRSKQFFKLQKLIRAHIII